jgi:predicted signal transduction protein with EAL and GGDEF domain
VLELTEGIAMENPVAVRALLLQLRAIGVRVSVDDFGTGHSSLAYLRQFPLHSLKVDRSFVRGIEGNRDMASIVSAVTTMAQQLGPACRRPKGSRRKSSWGCCERSGASTDRAISSRARSPPRPRRCC